MTLSSRQNIQLQTLLASDRQKRDNSPKPIDREEVHFSPDIISQLVKLSERLEEWHI